MKNHKFGYSHRNAQKYHNQNNNTVIGTISSLTFSQLQVKIYSNMLKSSKHLNDLNDYFHQQKTFKHTQQ